MSLSDDNTITILYTHKVSVVVGIDNKMDSTVIVDSFRPSNINTIIAVFNNKQSFTTVLRCKSVEYLYIAFD